MSSLRSFQPYSSSCIGFASNWQQADATVRVNASSSIGSQTDALSLSDSCTVPIGCVETEVQTGADDETKLDCPTGAISIEPLITDALVANVKQLRAFDRYLLAIGRLSNDNGDGSIERLFNLRSTKKVTDDEPAPSVLCIHWNSSGSTLAVGYGHATHSDWCTHRGGSGVGTWNLDRSARRVDANAPDRSIDLDSCVTAVRYNAGGDQQLLAIGTYVGDVFIADTDRVLYEARASDDASHRQTVSALDWLDRTRPISCARDGRVLVWSVPTRGQQLQLTIALQVGVECPAGAIIYRFTTTGYTLIDAQEGLSLGQFAGKSPYK
jgi:WD40 repeat protein